MKLGVPFAVVGFLLSLSFSVLARQAGFSVLQAIVTSVVVFAGSAQFAMLSVISVGGGIPAALTAASLMNSRFLAMGVALAPSLPGGPLKRAVQGQTVVDSSWALANRGDGTFDRWLLFGTTVPQYLTWALGSVVGAVFGDALGDTHRLGLDAIYPVFFLSLLITELRDRDVALGGGRRGPPRPGPGADQSAGHPHPGREHRRAHRSGAEVVVTLTSTQVWVLILGCAALTMLIKAFGPVLLGGRELPAWFSSVIVLMAPTLLCALVVTSVFASGRSWSVGAHTVGVAVAGVMLWRRHSLVLCVVVAVLVTAGLRAI